MDDSILYDYNWTHLRISTQSVTKAQIIGVIVDQDLHCVQTTYQWYLKEPLSAAPKRWVRLLFAAT